MTRNQSVLPSMPQPQIPDQAFLPTQTWVSNVVVPVAQNVAGGFGAFILALIAALKLGNAPVRTAIEIALVVAGIVFGIAMLIRAFRDEAAIIIGHWAVRQDRATQDELRRQIVALSAEMERLKKLNLLHDRFEAQAAAEQMIFDHFRGTNEKGQPLKINRTPAMSRGMTRAAWEAGTEILKRAGVVDQHGVIVATSYTVAMSAVLRHMAQSTTYVRTADGDFSKL